MNAPENAGFSAQAVANAFLARAEVEGRPLTNMQLQKLVYIAHGYSLGVTGRPLTYNNVHAWQFGPVIPKLYKALQKFGNGRVTSRLAADDEVPAGDPAMRFIDFVWQHYKVLSGSQLSALTHLPGSPWEETWSDPAKRFKVIDRDLIQGYYEERIAKHAEAGV